MIHTISKGVLTGDILIKGDVITMIVPIFNHRQIHCH